MLRPPGFLRILVMVFTLEEDFLPGCWMEEIGRTYVPGIDLLGLRYDRLLLPVID